MKNIIFISTVIILLLSSCYGVNEKNSYIFTLSNCCNSDEIWKDIISKYSPNELHDSNSQDIVKDFKSQPFRTFVIYFDDEPKEYIAISENNRFVRYVYNMLRIGRTEDEALEKLEQEAMGAIIAQRLALKR